MLVNPEEMDVLTSLILPVIQFYNGNHPLRPSPRREWNTDYHTFTLSLLESLCVIEKQNHQMIPLSYRIITFIQQFLEMTFQTVQQQHQLFVRGKFSPSSSSFSFLQSIFCLLKFFIFCYHGDAYSSLLSYGNIQFLYSVLVD